MEKKGYINIKLVIPNLRLVYNTPNHISDAFDKLFKGHGVSLTKQLHRDRGFSMPSFPIEGQTLAAARLHRVAGKEANN